MKTIFAAVLLMSATAHAVVPDVAQKLVGSYVASGACKYETADVKVSRSQGMDYFTVTLAAKDSGTFKIQSINMDNMWTKVKTTRGFQRIITQDRVREGAMVAEEKTCSLGWVNCSEWKTALEAKLVDDSTMDVTVGEESCTFSKE